jgi:hypothetical protein
MRQQRRGGGNRGEQRVAVGCGLGSLRGPGRPCRARHVLDHDRLAESAREPLCNQPGQDVGRAAGRERHDQADGLLRIGCLCARFGARTDDKRYEE